MTEIKIGSVCRSDKQELGVVTGVEDWWDDAPSGVLSYKGVKLDGSSWETRTPVFVAPNIKEFILMCAMDLDLFAEVRA
jgi:hypothetical protein